MTNWKHSPSSWPKSLILLMFFFPGNERAVLSSGGRVYGAQCWSPLPIAQVQLDPIKLSCFVLLFFSAKCNVTHKNKTNIYAVSGQKLNHPWRSNYSRMLGNPPFGLRCQKHSCVITEQFHDDPHGKSSLFKNNVSEHLLGSWFVGFCFIRTFRSPFAISIAINDEWASYGAHPILQFIWK